jgi:hypothetical protein
VGVGVGCATSAPVVTSSIDPKNKILQLVSLQNEQTNKKKVYLEPKQRVAVIWARVAVVCGHSRLVQAW